MVRRRRSALFTQRKRKRVETVASTDGETNTTQNVNPYSSSIDLPTSSVLVANSSESSLNVTLASVFPIISPEFKPSSQTSVGTLPVANNSIPVQTDINSVNCDIPSSNNMFQSNVDTIQSVQRPSVIQRVTSSAIIASTSSDKNLSLESSGDHQSLERNINLDKNPGCRTQSETGGESFGMTDATPATVSVHANQEVIVIDDDHDGIAAPGPSGTQIPDSDKATEVKSDDCPVCLQTPVHPSRLPCSHVFCYLCLKGIALSKQTCPLCRAIIPFHYSHNPQLVPDISNSQNCNEDTDEKFYWFYEGRNGGWWQFEKRMSEEIDSNVENGSTRFEMMICGSLYIIDTCLNIQFPKNYPGKVRKLLRERLSRINLKGVAGILRRQIPSTSTF